MYQPVLGKCNKIFVRYYFLPIIFFLNFDSSKYAIYSKHLSAPGEFKIPVEKVPNILNGLCLLVGAVIGSIYNATKISVKDAQKYQINKMEAKMRWKKLQYLNSKCKNAKTAGKYLISILDNLIDRIKLKNPNLPHLSTIGAGEANTSLFAMFLEFKTLYIFLGKGKFLTAQELADYGFLEELNINLKIYSRNHQNNLIFDSANYLPTTKNKLQVPLYAYSLSDLEYQTQFLPNEGQNDNENFFSKMVETGQRISEDIEGPIYHIRPDSSLIDFPKNLKKVQYLPWLRKHSIKLHFFSDFIP